MSTAPTASQFNAKKSSTGFNCSMDGYVSIVNEITQLLLSILTIYNEIIISILPTDLGLAVGYFYQGLTGASSWMGYGVAAIYFMGVDQGFGDTLCEVSGYGYVVIDALYQVINFAPTKTATV